MSDIHIRVDGRAGRITLNRPDALNALTYDMALAIEAALDTWRNQVELIIIDAEGDRAFCAGGDIADLYARGMRGDHAYGQKFWRDEYRLNAKIFEYPLPIVSLLQGFTMGGGVGVGCHGTHRIVCETSQIAMPECGIGLVPDVGGSMMLAMAPGHVGEYLGMTGTRMGPADAIYTGFADWFIPKDKWEKLVSRLAETGNLSIIEAISKRLPQGDLEVNQSDIDCHFTGASLADIKQGLLSESSDFTNAAWKTMSRNAPLSMACCMQIVRNVRSFESIRPVLEMEYRFTYRALAQGDFLEGIRAMIIDKDRNPKWKYDSIDDLPAEEVEKMLAPLGVDALTWEDL